MSNRGSAVVAAALSMVAAVSLGALSCMSREEASQRHYIRRMTPDEVYGQTPPPERPAEPPQVIRLSVHADAAYRNHLPDWQGHVIALLDRVEQVTLPIFNVRFAVVDYLPWEREIPTSDLAGVLAELEAVDAGDDVDLVVGFISPLDEAGRAEHRVGMARHLGSHFVMRHMESATDHDVFHRGLTRVEREERDHLYRSRRLHQELTVFLHQWGTCMGALPTHDPRYLMSPIYNNRAAQYAPPNEEIIRLGLAQLQMVAGGVPRDEVRVSWREALVALLDEHADWRDWFGGELEAAGELLRRGPVTAASGMRGSEVKRFNRAVSALRAGDVDGAWGELEPLVDLRPESAQVQLLACQIQGQREPVTEEALARCRAAVAAAPEEALPLMELARVTLATDRGTACEGVAPLLRRARDRLRQPPPSGQCRFLAQLALAADNPALAEEVEACHGQRAPALEVARLRTATRALRRRWGMPPVDTPHALPARGEPCYVAELRHLQELLSDKRFEEAQQALTALETHHSRVPGTHVARCELHVRRQQAKRARRACRRAIEAWEETARAHLLMSYVEEGAHDMTAAFDTAQRAVELLPDDGAAWQRLEKLAPKAGRAEELQELRARLSGSAAAE